VSAVAESPLAAGPTSSATTELAGTRVLLVHEWLYTWAGAERVLEQLVELMPHADVLAGIVTPDMRRTHEIARRAQESWVGKLPGAHASHRWFLPLHALAFAAFDTSKYDLVISVSHAFEKAIRARKPGAVHLSYCLSPPRYLWNLRDAHDELATAAQWIALRTARPLFRQVDRLFATGVHHFVSLSRGVADRVRQAYGRDSAVVYPPVQAKGDAAASSARENFLLTLGRLVPYKRVDLAIHAAERLGMRLVIAGDGPERARLERIAGSHSEFRGYVSDEEASRLMSTCAAFVFCAEEDFGIAPVEANASGAPVVAYRRGGTTETIIDGETGVLFQEQSVEALCAAIQRCLAASWDAQVLRRNAERFAPKHFRNGMLREIRAALSRRA
jgi:glycosyltransferase involved in cell wall biosynthesis